MSKNKNNNINWRAFTSMFILFSFLLIAISGFILYFSPPGRIAHWSNWTIIALSKESWQAVHTIFSFIFIITAVFHLKFNWKPLMAYLKKKIEEGRKVRKELTLAGSFSLLILVLTLGNLPPFGSVMTFGQFLSNSWATEDNTPPVPHAELMTLTEFAATINVPTDKVIVVLEKAGFKPENSSVKINQLAKQYGVTPKEIYDAIKSENPAQITHVAGSGYGLMSIEQISEKLQLPVGESLAKLASNGIHASADSNLKDLARKHNLNPIDIVNILKPSFIN